MKAIILPRVFLHKAGAQEIRLDDPNPNFSPADVQQFYTGSYPILTNAKLTGPEVKDGEVQFRFETTIGVKG